MIAALPSVYECDKAAAEICRDMSIAGFGFDRGRAAELASTLRQTEIDVRDKADQAVGRPIMRTATGGFGTKDLAQAFFRDLRAPVLMRSDLTGQPSLGVDVMRSYAAGKSPELRALSLAVLEWRRARKIRKTYIENIVIGDDGRVHPNWHNYGAISGRWACQSPNLMNLPTSAKDPTIKAGGIRSLYVPCAGCVLVAFDCKQLEMRVAAYASGDDVMIRACGERDLHSSNAVVIFGSMFDLPEYVGLTARKDAGEKLPPDAASRLVLLKGLRTLAKSAGFAVCYMAEAETVYARIVADGVPATLQSVKAMLRKLRTGFHGYFSWQDRRYLECVRTGVVTSPILGRARWVGHDPSPTECANHPIQGGAADFMNLRLPMLVRRLRASRLSATVVAQVHDSVVFEVPIAQADEVAAACRTVFEAPIVIRSSGRALEATFPIDVEVSTRWH